MRPHASPAPSPGSRILPLSAAAVAQIHSSKHITSLQDVVCSLLENSLDAGATKIDVSVDWARGCCTVDDDGSGIPISEFAENGGLCRMYCTSKQNQHAHAVSAAAACHGSTGTFLAHLAAMSMLTIESTRLNAAHSASLSLHQGNVIGRHVVSAESSGFATLHRNHGTVVSVRDLFGNMPVRVKQRALLAENGAGHEKSWHGLKRGIVALLLVWPRPCTVRLRTEGAHSQVLTLGTSTATGRGLTEKALEQLAGKAASFDLRDVLHILFQSNLAPPESRRRWVPLSASTAALRLKGMICVDPAPSKQCQFIAIGVTPCSLDTGNHELYHAVNKIFSKSSFGVVDDVRKDEEGHCRKTSSHSVKQARGVDRNPMYYLQLEFREATRAEAGELDRMSEKSIQTILDVLEAAVTAWLENNHFRPRKRRKRTNLDQDAPARESHSSSETASPRPGPVMISSSAPVIAGFQRPREASEGSKRRKRAMAPASMETGVGYADATRLPDTTADMTMLSAIRIGRQHSRAAGDKPEARQVQEECPSTQDRDSHCHQRAKVQCPPIEVDDYNRLPPPHAVLGDDSEDEPFSDDFRNVDDEDLLAAELDLDSEATGKDGSITWTDPVSLQTFQVNSRTGVVLPTPKQDSLGIPIRQQAAIDTALTSTGKPITLARRNALGECNARKENAPTHWIPGFLKEWNNPVFARPKEAPIPTASLSGPGLLELEQERKCCGDMIQQRFDGHKDISSTGTQLSKASLKEAVVIGQVDQKFILIKMPAAHPQTGHILVLIDQHAASERIILERLLTEMCDLPLGDQDSRTVIRTTSLVQDTTRHKSLSFEVSSKEHHLFSYHRPHFQHWGIQYTLSPSHPASPATTSPRITITHLPTPVAERCSATPALAIDLLRTELWALADHVKKPFPPLPHHLPQEPEPDPDPTPHPETSPPLPPWLPLLPHLPTKLLDMLHSRACRSAVMFNDPLRLSECADLLRALARCVFPFVCAHGRVGLVPVLEVGGEGVPRGGEERFGGGGGGGEGLGVDGGEMRRFLEGWRGRRR